MNIYNLKILEYPNGSAQIRIYHDPVGYDGSKEPKEFEIEPFTGKKILRTVNSFDELIINSLNNREKSLARTRAKINTYARCMHWEWFCTFTYSPEKNDRTDFSECMAKLRNWLQNVRKRNSPELAYVCVPELHSDMVTWHGHLLLSNTGNLQFTDSGRRASGQIIYNVPGWRWGFSTATKVLDTYRIQKYICKYLTKECHLMSKGAHRYYVSNNLPAPKESVMCVEPAEQENTVQQIAESLGMEISYRSEVKGYIDVTYIELK